MILCGPTSARIKRYPFEVALAGEPTSVVLADQVTSQNWCTRKAVRRGGVSVAGLAEVQASRTHGLRKASASASRHRS